MSVELHGRFVEANGYWTPAWQALLDEDPGAFLEGELLGSFFLCPAVAAPAGSAKRVEDGWELTSTHILGLVDEVLRPDRLHETR